MPFYLNDILFLHFPLKPHFYAYTYQRYIHLYTYGTHVVNYTYGTHIHIYTHITYSHLHLSCISLYRAMQSTLLLLAAIFMEFHTFYSLPLLY